MKAISFTGVVKSFNSVQVVRDLTFDIERGEVVTLLGPSGCGKTTTLRLIAGLERPDAGEITVDGSLVSAPAKGIHVPPHKRGIGMVFQSYALWPHMTVADNVAYPLHAWSFPASEVKERVMKALELVGMAGYADRPAPALSGGQQQRIAIARAIVAETALLLMDEPLSNLDVRLRVQTRRELRELQERLKITTVYVTHDQSEAMALSDRIIVMNNGKIEQIGDSEDIYQRPVSRFVTEFVGTANVFTAKPVDSAGGAGPQRWQLEGIDEEISGPPAESAAGESVLVIRPEHILLVETPSSDARDGMNCLTGQVEDSTFLGDRREHRIRIGLQRVTVQGDASQRLNKGDRILACFRSEHVRRLDEC